MSESFHDLVFRDNNSQRLPCVLVLDLSSSMGGEAIQQLNAGLRQFEDDLRSDPIASQRVQVLIVTFSGEDAVDVPIDWTDAGDFIAPTLRTSGMTPMGKAMRVALKKIEEQKSVLRSYGISYNRPWLFLISDGEPTDANWEEAARDALTAARDGKVSIFPIGVGEANTEKLGRFSNKTSVRMQGLKFRELFQWLSGSASNGSRQATNTRYALPSPSSWAADM